MLPRRNCATDCGESRNPSLRPRRPRRRFRLLRETAGRLGAYFLDSLFADIDSLTLYAGIHRQVFGSHRLLARTFPFAIYYAVESNTARVKAVLDCRRDPKWIREKLKEGI
jgi:hypothetical protein